MSRLASFVRHILSNHSVLLEVGGIAIVAVGLHEVYYPAGVIFAGAALVFLA